MKFWKMSLLVLMSALLCANAAFAANWSYVGKDKDGSSWYYDAQSVKVVNYSQGTNYHINVIVKIVPVGNTKKFMGKTFRQAVASVVEQCRVHGRECSFEVVGGKVFGTNGKAMAVFDTKLCEVCSCDWEGDCIQETLFQKLWTKVN